MKALFSVSDKSGIEVLAKAVINYGFSIISSGGTYAYLKDRNLDVQEVSKYTKSPELLEGRVKTLHPKIHAGILAKRKDLFHLSQLKQKNIDEINLVVVNLYPFVEKVNSKESEENIIENIDIGGPTLIRSAAKNFKDVIIVVDPDDYNWVAEKIMKHEKGEDNNNILSYDERRTLARKAFQHVANYDAAISRYFSSSEDQYTSDQSSFGYEKLLNLRYGENPHQNASLYKDPLNNSGIANSSQLNGKELSFNNILDADAAWNIVSEFSDSAVAIIKHGNPCGFSVNQDQLTSYKLAYLGDTVSAYGGIVAFNTEVKAETASNMMEIFYEVVIAPSYTIKALDILKSKKNLRILQMPNQKNGKITMPDIKVISGGALIQGFDVLDQNPSEWNFVTKLKPNNKELIDLKIAWKIVKHIKSNGIVLVKDNSLIGMGAGQPNRLNSINLALNTAGEKSQGSVLASDAFFPYRDNVDLALSGGVSSIIQPGGSIRDKEVINASDEAQISMVFTGNRHFKH
ncbi:MAG: bifunctional phosphoribosylaminoimidazolecarboxamide formyltransferase/inosine monophosphate cyclohydrolase [Chloroflexi bacterium]|nr:bifunctional phosphoribosylaminoimidazolecarboxamide formyltransferase/inosine monophosphate cyclohydrolase [Chloroflexota bacterium]